MFLTLLAIVVACGGTQAAPSSAIFDEATVQQLMALRRQFDEAELAAIRDFDSALGAGQLKVAIPREDYQAQRMPAMEHRWTDEQKRRAAQAWPRRQAKIDEAERRLSQQTVAILRKFGYGEDRLPSIRRRKWDGPVVYAFTSQISPESRVLLQELRRLWQMLAWQRDLNR